MGRHTERVKKHHYNMGFLYGMTFTAVIYMIVGALFHIVWMALLPCLIIIPILIISDFINLKRREGSIMGNYLKRILGIRKLQMKMQALVDYFGLGFRLIPEHYECFKKETS